MEEQGGGAQIVKVEHMTQPTVCKGFGHKASQCRNKNMAGPPNVGGGKKAGADTGAAGAGAGLDPVAEAEKLSKGARRRRNLAIKKEEEERMKVEAEKAAKSATIRTFKASDTEEDSPKRPVYSARQARVTGRGLFTDLNTMNDSSVERLGEEVFRALAARATEVDNSATTVGSAYARLTGGKGCEIPIIWDTGCSMSIISEEAVRSLGSQITELDRLLAHQVKP